MAGIDVATWQYGSNDPLQFPYLSLSGAALLAGKSAITKPLEDAQRNYGFFVGNDWQAFNILRYQNTSRLSAIIETLFRGFSSANTCSLFTLNDGEVLMADKEGHQGEFIQSKQAFVPHPDAVEHLLYQGAAAGITTVNTLVHINFQLGGADQLRYFTTDEPIAIVRPGPLKFSLLHRSGIFMHPFALSSLSISSSGRNQNSETRNVSAESLIQLIANTSAFRDKEHLNPKWPPYASPRDIAMAMFSQNILDSK